eukprot:605689-Pyramimonas_sp.AAC.1
MPETTSGKGILHDDDDGSADYTSRVDAHNRGQNMRTYLLLGKSPSKSLKTQSGRNRSLLDHTTNN